MDFNDFKFVAFITTAVVAGLVIGWSGINPFLGFIIATSGFAGGSLSDKL